MLHRILVLALLLASIVVAPLTLHAFAQEDDRWYIGKSVTADSYYIYTIQDFEVNGGAQYTMSIHFKEQDSEGNWIAPVYIVENNGNVINGTLSLGENLAVRAGDSSIPKEMNPYIDGYKDTLTWLEAFTSKGSPQSLKAVSWGKIACIGCGTLDPAGTEQVTAAGITFDTTVMLNHRGQKDSKIWIAKELPYPVKALTYADVTTGVPPIQYAFDLIKTGTGQPPQPESETRIPTPPLTLATGRGTYKVTLSWTPEQILPGRETTFTTSIADSNGNPLQRVNYDLVMTGPDKVVIEQFKSQFTGDDSQSDVKVTLDSGGPINVNVKINSISGVDTGNFVEDVNFGIVAVPEFPVGIAAIVSLLALAGVVVGLRLKQADRLFGAGLP